MYVATKKKLQSNEAKLLLPLIDNLLRYIIKLERICFVFVRIIKRKLLLQNRSY